MSSTSSEYLLETLVTWQDVELELQKSLGTTAKFGEKRKVTNFGHMKGFMSRIALIDADWTDSKAELPAKFIVKICSSLGMQDLFDVISFLKPDSSSDSAPTPESEPSAAQDGKDQMTRLYHNREVDTYKLIARENNPNLRTTKIFASRPYLADSEGFLICEYIPNVHNIPLYGTIGYTNLVPVITAAGAFSAIGERMSDAEKTSMGGEDRLEEGFRTFFRPEVFPKIQKLLQEALGDEASSKIEDVMRIIDVICGPSGILKNYSKMSAFLGHRPVLMHSDLWSANMLFTKTPEAEDVLEFKALIDFQDTSFGGAGVDVASVAVCCMSSEDRHRHRDDLLQKYFESFVANLTSSDDVPYTLTQLRESYDLCFVLLAVQILPIVWSLAIHNGSDEALKMAKDKMIGLIDDAIEIQKANVENFPEFFKI